MQDLPRVCVIGAGVSGLVTCKALGDRGIPFTCFESSDDVGGIWYFRNPSGRGSAYRSLHINISRRSISFRDFPMSDRYPDYPHHTEVLEYLREYADVHGLREHIRFNTTVQRCDRLPRGGWRVTLDDGSVEAFDAMLVANGHHWDPSYPDPALPGCFDGDVIHSHHYIDPTEPLDLTDRRVLVVGLGNSAADIVSELSRRGVADKVFLSTRGGGYVLPKYAFGRPTDEVGGIVPRVPLRLQLRLASIVPRLLSGRMQDYGLPKPDHRFLQAQPTVSGELLLRLGSGDAVAKPGIAELQGDRVQFKDGSVERVDTIIYATGYKITFPFFDEEFLSAPGNVFPLYKRMFKPGIDDLAFVGLAQPIPTIFPFAETQAKFLAAWLVGDWALPPEAEMERELRADHRKYAGHFTKRPRHTMMHFTALYEHELRRRTIPAGRKRARTAGRALLAGRAGDAALAATEA